MNGSSQTSVNAMQTQPEYQAYVAVWKYCPPFLLAFGTFGNIMTIIILRRMNFKRSAMPVFLTALAVSDMTVLYTGLLRWWIKHTLSVDIRVLHTVVCKIHTWLVYATVIISAWILTFMTAERALSVWLPHRVNLLCTRRKACVIVSTIVVMSLSVNSHFLYGLEVVDPGNGTSTYCGSHDDEYMYFFDAVWSWVDLTLASLIPVTVLIIGNVLILWKVTQSVREVRTLSAGCPDEFTQQRRKKVSSMTITLIALSVIFLLTTSPVCVYNIIEHFVEADLQDDPRGMARLKLAWAITNVLMYTNSTVNFYLYCLSGANFRRELKKCLCCHDTSLISSDHHGSRLHNLQHIDHNILAHPSDNDHGHSTAHPKYSPNTTDSQINSTNSNGKAGGIKLKVYNNRVKNLRSPGHDQHSSTEF